MITQLTDKQKLNWVRSFAILSMLIMMLYAPKLWITTKDFPVIPLFDGLPIPKYPFDYILAITYALSMLIYLFKPKRWLGVLIVVLYVFLSFIDQNRLQPYFYQSMLTILAIVLYKEHTKTKKVLHTVILIFLATYFWSGIHKVNGIFYTQWMHALQKHFSFIPEILLQLFTYAVPWLEALMGVLLLFNKTRKIGVFFIIIMHSIIVIMLFYLGYGYNVVPWNLQNILSVFIIFWSLKTDSFTEFFAYQLSYQKIILLVFTVILPISNLFGGWDHLLSFSFFSSKLNYYYVEINEELENKLPNHIKRYFRYNNNKPIIYLNEWSGDVNKVLFYPEDRIANYMDVYLRSFADNPQKKGLTKLVVYNK